jgi:hypothetical protein
MAKSGFKRPEWVKQSVTGSPPQEVEQVFRRRQVKNHTRLAKDELNESFGHLRMAAAHAADGAAGALAPRVDAARKAVKPTVKKARGKAQDSVDSLFTVAAAKSRDAQRMAQKGRKQAMAKMGKKQKSRRWPMVLGGLLATGVAAGAASVLMKKRRSDQPWDEYDSTRKTSDTSAVLGQAKTTVEAGINKASTAAAAAKDRASDLIGSKSSTPTKPDGTPSMVASSDKTMTDKTVTDKSMADLGSKNGRP